MDQARLARYPSLSGRTVLITGGGSGIGAAIVEAFLLQEARVAFLDIDEPASRALCRDMADRHGKSPLFLACDLSDPPALERAMQAARDALGDPTVLVNNAANDDRHSWAGATPEYWDRSLAVNLRPMFLTIRCLAPAMAAAGGGAIVNFGSISWRLKNGGYPAYTAAKAAVHGLTTSAARDFGKAGVRVNTILPGWVMTERQRRLWLKPEDEPMLDKAQCLPGRLGPEDLARATLFLCSDEARMITGQELIVDAGWV